LALVASGDPAPEFGFHRPLPRPPLAFETRLETIPLTKTYLHAPGRHRDVPGWQFKLQSGFASLASSTTIACRNGRAVFQVAFAVRCHPSQTPISSSAAKKIPNTVTIIFL
jgi:hypothetical protein